jgi:NTE family protein
VLSGGGNLGPLQVGALRALLERGQVPDVVVGCSAGALNAAYLAREPSLAQIERLAGVWRSTRRRDVYPGSALAAVWRFLSGKDSLYDNRGFYAFLQRQGSTPMETFASMAGAQLFITATHLRSGQLYVFGENGNDRVLDALMASTALPPMHPPWLVDGEQYIDGGTVTPLPLRVAIDHGATEIYALHVGNLMTELPESGLVRGLLQLLNRSVLTMLHLQAEHDLLLARTARHVRLTYLSLRVPNPPGQTDFSQADRLIARGYAIACQRLDGAPARQSTGTAPRVVRYLRRVLSRAPLPVPGEEVQATDPMDTVESP